MCIIIESLVLFGICQLVRISQSNQFFSLHQFHTWVSPGGGMSWRSHSSTPENGEIIFYYIGPFLILFFHYRRLFSLFKGFFGYFFLLGGGGGFFIHVGGPFAIFFSIWGGLFFYLKILFGLMRGGHFWGLPNPPPLHLQTFLRAPMVLYVSLQSKHMITIPLNTNHDLPHIYMYMYNMNPCKTIIVIYRITCVTSSVFTTPNDVVLFNLIRVYSAK